MAQTQQITQPSIIVNDFQFNPGVRKCRVIAAESQVPYEYLRRDEINLTFSDNSGNVQVTLSGAPTVAITQGELIYIFARSLNTAPDLDGEYVVTSVIDPTNFVINAAWGGSYDTTSNEIPEQAYFNRLSAFSDYTFKFRFKEAITGQLLFDGTFFGYRSASNGKIFANFSRLLRDLSQRGDFQIQTEVTELKNGTEPAFSSSGIDAILVTEAQMQLQEDGAPAMVSRLLNKQNTTYAINVFGTSLNTILNEVVNGKAWTYQTTGIDNVQILSDGRTTNNDSNVFSQIGNFGAGATMDSGSIMRITLTGELDAGPVNVAGVFGWEFYGRPAGGGAFVRLAEYLDISIANNETIPFKREFLIYITQDVDLIGFRWVSDLVAEARVRVVVQSVIVEKTNSNFPFLTRFNSDLNRNEAQIKKVYPKLYEGYANRLSFVNDPELNTRTGATEINARVAGFDVNFANPGLTRTASYGNNVGVNTFNVSYIPGNHKYYRVMLTDQSLADLTGEYYFEYVPSGQQCKNPLMIQWLNSLAGQSQWLFERQQEITDEPERGLIFKNPITDRLSEANGAIGREISEVRTTINVIAEGLSFTQLQALKEIKSSREVQVWLTKDGSRFVDVIVSSGFVTPFENKSISDRSYSFEATITFPDNFNLYNDQDFIREFIQPPQVTVA